MIVTLIAKTEMVDLPNSVFASNFNMEIDSGFRSEVTSQADRLAHFSGRACYQAWNMPNPATANDMGYLANIIKQGHFSVLEHASATFYIEGVSRNLTHELIRHRHLSYSELSQRYVDMSEAQIVVPPAERDKFGELRSLPYDALKNYDDAVTELLAEGKTRKQAREAARFYLPSATETKIVVTGNHRAWRDMLQKRYSVHADAEIRELATELLRQLRLVAPATYQDFPEEPFQ